MQIFIDEISGRYIGENLIMVLDGASWHKSKRLRLPENIKFLFLPPYSPELNPIEMFWGELKEKFLHNRVFDNIDSLENQLVNGLMYYEANNDITKSVVAWEWIINAICILN
jgi:transposase